MKRVAVIGGGISGLAAALTLCQQAGRFEVCLLESSSRVGGVLETVRDGPYLIERSADNFATLIPDALELSREQGLADKLIRPAVDNRQAFVLHRGRVLPIPAGFSLMQPTRVGSILATRTLSWAAKLRLLGEFWVPPRTSLEDESLQSFATRRLGRETYENLVEPIVSGIFTADPATLSMQATMPQFFEMERKSGGLIRGHRAARKQDAAAAARRASGARYEQFVAPRDGMSSWVADLASRLPAGCLRLETPVLGLQSVPGPAGTTWEITTANEKLAVDAVLCATPATVTAQLLRGPLPQAADIVAGIPYASSAVVALVVDRSQLSGRLDGFGLIVPRKEGLSTLAVSYSSNKYPGRVPQNELLLRVFLGGALSPQTVERSDDELLELASRELKRILGWQGTRAKWQAVIRWREAMPQYLVGHVARMQQLDSYLAAFPTLKLCGAAYSGVGIAQCVRGGRRAARELSEFWNDHAQVN
ncbi:MAG: protoporphyrinogen oxidase [Planctomycetales bacterium]|nr:protoporphyrinogen oxidase [Planctomycetales bacterium]